MNDFISKKRVIEIINKYVSDVEWLEYGPVTNEDKLNLIKEIEEEN